VTLGRPKEILTAQAAGTPVGRPFPRAHEGRKPQLSLSPVEVDPNPGTQVSLTDSKRLQMLLKNLWSNAKFQVQPAEGGVCGVNVFRAPRRRAGAPRTSRCSTTSPAVRAFDVSENTQPASAFPGGKAEADSSRRSPAGTRAEAGTKPEIWRHLVPLVFLPSSPAELGDPAARPARIICEHARKKRPSQRVPPCICRLKYFRTDRLRPDPRRSPYNPARTRCRAGPRQHERVKSNETFLRSPHLDPGETQFSGPVEDYFPPLIRAPFCWLDLARDKGFQRFWNRVLARAPRRPGPWQNSSSRRRCGAARPCLLPGHAGLDRAHPSLKTQSSDRGPTFPVQESARLDRGPSSLRLRAARFFLRPTSSALTTTP